MIQARRISREHLFLGLGINNNSSMSIDIKRYRLVEQPDDDGAPPLELRIVKRDEDGTA